MAAQPEVLAEARGVARELLRDARAGRLQRSLALVAAGAGGMSGLEVAYMHYRGSYNQRIMYTPVILSQALAAAGVWAALQPRPGRRVLRAVAAATLADCAAGFIFHIRGIQRKPGGWRVLVPNLAMGPPPFAPLLFGTSAYLGWVATEMPEEVALQSEPAPLPWRRQGEARLRRHLAAIAGISAICSGVEALYSHQKSGFRFWVQWTPIVMAPLLAAAAFISAARGRGQRALGALSLLAMADGAVGTLYHTRGVLRRPGGRHHLAHNIMYGPPVLAPLLFAACGFMGLLASVMRGQKS